MDYFRVRSGNKTWADKGPDLLRLPANAKATVRDIIRDEAGFVTRFETREGPFTEWNKANRSQVMDRLSSWMRDARGVFQIGVAEGGKTRIVAVVKYERVRYVDLPHCARATSVAWSLITHQFGSGVVLSGAFLYRQIDGSSAWSDHAWGTALDNSPKGKTENDDLFDWEVRMARIGSIEADYILGSLKGEVRQASAPEFEIRPSGASVSHTWHVHISTRDHDGAKPPRNPMFP